MFNLSLVALCTIIANGVISYKGFEDRLFFERYKFNVGSIRRGEHIRMFTSGFLHLDATHLIMNMVTLYFFADVVVVELGSFKFVLIYVASLIFGNLLSLYFHQNDYWYSAIGASGAVTGILYAAILLRPDMSLYMFFIPIPIPGYVFGIGYLLYSIYGMKKNIGNIGHDAHFGGAVGGYVLTLVLDPTLFQTELFHVGLLALPIVILFVLYKTGKLDS